MNAKSINLSQTLLFQRGGTLLALWGQKEMTRQFDEMRAEETNNRRAWRDLTRFAEISECPCGCGLRGEICEAQAERVRIANEELPF